MKSTFKGIDGHVAHLKAVKAFTDLHECGFTLLYSLVLSVPPVLLLLKVRLHHQHKMMVIRLLVVSCLASMHAKDRAGVAYTK